MDAHSSTTYYPAILLRRRWHESKADPAQTFGLEAELASICAEAPLSSTEVSALERWSAGSATAVDLGPSASRNRTGRERSLSSHRRLPQASSRLRRVSRRE